MVNISSYISEFIRADELAAGDTMTILNAGELELGKYGKQLQFEVDFHKEQRKFTMNRSNADACARVFGPDTEKWVGKQLKIERREVRIGKEIKHSIVVFASEVQ